MVLDALCKTPAPQECSSCDAACTLKVNVAQGGKMPCFPARCFVRQLTAYHSNRSICSAKEKHHERLSKLETDPRVPELQTVAHDYHAFKKQV